MNGFNYTMEIGSDILQSTMTYDEFRVRLESGPHQSIHNGIGGEMPTDWSPNGTKTKTSLEKAALLMLR
jgi:tyrosinase